MLVAIEFIEPAKYPAFERDIFWIWLACQYSGAFGRFSSIQNYLGTNTNLPQVNLVCGYKPL